MPRLTKQELADTPTQLAERLTGKTLEFGEARVHIRPLTRGETLLLFALTGEGEAASAGRADLAARFGITGWEMQYEDGEAVPFRRERVGYRDETAVPLELIDLIPDVARIQIGGEVMGLTEFKESEGRRLDFTLQPRRR